jgi:hypothetical protein
MKTDFVCKPENEKPTVVFNAEKDTIVFESKDACGYINKLALIINNNKFLYSAILIVAGIILTFFGGYKWESLVGIIGIFLGTSMVLVVVCTYVYFPPNTTSYIIIALLIISISFIFYYLFKTASSLVFLIIGFAFGYIFTEYFFIMTHIAV